MSINPDAHSTRELDLTHWGVEMARKGGVPKERVLNCFSKDELATYLEKKRAQRRKGAAVAQRRRPRPRASGTGKPSTFVHE
jgi:DNA polymerase (family X)